jgi:hypothetical protein
VLCCPAVAGGALAVLVRQKEKKACACPHHAAQGGFSYLKRAVCDLSRASNEKFFQFRAKAVEVRAEESHLLSLFSRAEREVVI